MPSNPARGRVGWRLPFSPRDFVFLACVALTLTVAAVAFSGYRDHKAYTEYCKSSTHEGEQGCKAEKPFGESVFADPVVFFACITALFTGGLIVVGVLQAGLFWWQLSLIREGLSDTEDAAEAAKEQAKLARESLIASQRAWIKVSDVKLHDALYVRDGRASTTVTFRLENVGNAPGLQIAPWIRLGVVRRDGTHLTRFTRECEEQRLPPPFQAFLFPGEVFPPSDKPVAFPAHIKREDFEPGIHDEGGLKHVMPLIMGCIFYKFPTDRERFHQTRFIIEIQRPTLGRIAIDQLRPIHINELNLGEISWEDYSYAD